MNVKDKIYVAGGNTLIGSALIRELKRQGYRHVIGKSDDSPPLCDLAAVDIFFERLKPDYVFIAAGKSGGIAANQKYPAELMFDNLLTGCHVIHSSYVHGVKKLLYLASSCSYPRMCSQPMKEEDILTGVLEPTNEAYAVAKIAGLKLCQAYRFQYGVKFIVGIPANAFGPGDDFSTEDSHVVAALLMRMHEAKCRNESSVQIWGTGAPRREFIYADDLAHACVHVMQHYDDNEPINLGTGESVSIAELAFLIKDITEFSGEILFDPSRPDGMPTKVLDTQKLKNLGWKHRFSLSEALRKTYEWYTSQGV